VRRYPLHRRRRHLRRAQHPDRFGCPALVGAISALVTHALVDGGPKAVLALHEPPIELTAPMMRAEFAG
jgi:hypothetical protein